MEILNLQQGSPEWAAARAKRFTASEAPAMLGLSKYQTRDALLKQKATGAVEDIDPAKQRLFDRGHQAEAIARPLIEFELGEDLFPATGIASFDGLPLLASFDGLTMDESIVWENKLHNDALLPMFEVGDLSDIYWPQVEQQLLVSGAKEAIFTTCDGERIVGVLRYQSRPERRARLIAGWKQFAADLAAYVPAEAPRSGVAAPQETLPAVSVQVTGSIAIIDNLGVFGDALKAYVDRINQQPQTDDDFATLEAQVKVLKGAEDALTAAENNALGQAADIDTLRRTVAQYREVARQARLAAEKTVKAEKENRKNAIIQCGISAFREFTRGLALRFCLPMTMPDVPADFFGAAKGLKTIASIQNAVNTTLAQAKLDASALADRIAANLKTIEASGNAALFADYRTLALKDADDLAAVIGQRLAAFASEQERKLAAERERIAAEERRKIEAEQAARAAAEREAERIEQKHAQATVATNGASSTPGTSGVSLPADAAAQPPAPVAASPAPVAASDTGARIKLGEISAALGFTVTSDFLGSLGFQAETDRAAKLYRLADFPAICLAVAAHCNRVAAYGFRRAA